MTAFFSSNHYSLKRWAAVILALILFAEGCKKADVFRYTAKPEVILNGTDSRILNDGLVHLVKDTVYIFNSDITIKSGHTILIDAGTLIKTENIYLTIDSGATINAIGSADEPIVFTSNVKKGRAGIDPFQGTWKGIRIYGSQSRPTPLKLTYTRIEFAANNSSVPALNLRNISDNAVINNIQVSYAFAGAAFRLEGGNCNASELLSFATAGTDFDIRAGYTGKMQNLLAYRLPAYASPEPFGLRIRDSLSSPVISNFTMLGPDQKYGVNSAYISGLPFKRAGVITEQDCKFKIRNSVLFNYPAKSSIGNTIYYGYSYFLDGFSTTKALNFGPSEFTYSSFYHADTSVAFYIPPGTYPPYTSTDLKAFLLLPQMHNNLFVDVMPSLFTDPYNYYDGVPNPLPTAGSGLLSGANFDGPVYNDPFFKKVLYRGAIGTENWMKKWVNFLPLQTDYNN